MFSAIAALVVRLAAIRWAIKTLVGVGVLIPFAMILKVVGLPVLGILGVLAMPILLVLFVLGLPIFLVMIVGALLLAGLFFLLTMGVFVFKFFLFVVLPIWLAWKIGGFFWRLVFPRPAAAEVGGSQVS